MADPVTAIALGAQAVGGIAGGMAGRAEAEGERKRAEINAYIGRTRALQTDTVARQNMESELGSFRAAFGGMTPNVGALELLNEIRDMRGRERRIEVGNRMSEAADWRMQAANAGVRGRAAMIGGFMKAGPSLFDLAQPGVIR